MPSKPAGKQQLSIPSACFQEGGCSQSFRYPHRASPQHYSNFFCLPPHALTPSHLLSHLPVSLPAHSHFPLLTPEPTHFHVPHSSPRSITQPKPQTPPVHSGRGTLLPKTHLSVPLSSTSPCPASIQVPKV